MPAKGTKQSAKGKAAASANLKKWVKDHAHEGPLKHGAVSASRFLLIMIPPEAGSEDTLAGT